MRGLVVWAPWYGPGAKSQKLELSKGIWSLIVTNSGLYYTSGVPQNKQIVNWKDNWEYLQLQEIIF